MTTEIIFWCIAALLIAAALAAVAAAFMRTSRFCSPAGSSLEQSRALLNEELDLLARERGANLVSEAIYATALKTSGAVRLRISKRAPPACAPSPTARP